MDVKLTLKLNKQVIENAKFYALKRNISLSTLVESYLYFVTSDINTEIEEISPLVKSLSGVLKEKQFQKGDGAYKNHLRRKYS